MESFQIIIASVNNTNVSEDKNHAIIYKMATIYRSYCQMECYFSMKNEHLISKSSTVLSQIGIRSNVTILHKMATAHVSVTYIELRSAVSAGWLM